MPGLNVAYSGSPKQKEFNSMTSKEQHSVYHVYRCSSLFHLAAMFVFAIIQRDVCDALCQTIYQNTSDGRLGFVKKNARTEWSNYIIVTEGHRVQVPCEVNNYCVLIWTNGTGQPIVEEEDFIRLENQNQSLVILRARPQNETANSPYSQEVNYTCRASNGTDSVTRSIVLVVLDASPGVVAVGVPRLPKCQNTTAEKCETMTFVCQFIIPQSYFDVDVTWAKLNESDNNSFHNVEFVNDIFKELAGVTTQYDWSFSRDDGIVSNRFLIFNTTLYIHNISEEAYGVYRLEVNLWSPDAGGSFVLALNPQPVPKTVWSGLVGVWVFICVVLTISISLVLVYRRKKLEIQLYWKDNWTCQNPDTGNVENDAYISYCHNAVDPTDDDVNFVIDYLKTELERRRYRTNIRDINHLPGTSIHEEIVSSMDNSHRCILVISPAYLRSWISAYDVNVGVDSMQWRQIIPIIFKDVSNEPDLLNHKLLKHILDDHKCLKWPRAETGSNIEKRRRRFYFELMLRMPPPPPCTDGTLTADVEPVSETTPPNTPDVPLRKIHN